MAKFERTIAALLTKTCLRFSKLYREYLQFYIKFKPYLILLAVEK